MKNSLIYIKLITLRNGIKLFFMQLFWKNPHKKTKACSIYKTDKNYKIITMYPVSSGIFVEKEPVFILPSNINIEELKYTIFNSIRASKLISYKEYNKTTTTTKEYLRILREKSLKNLYQNSKSCSVYLENNVINVCFYKCLEKYRGLVEDEEENFSIEYSQENELKATKKLVDILNRNK